MVATTATDPNGVQYYFTETSGNPGSSDSGWQDSASFEDTGLDDRTEYKYTVKARDLSTNFNETVPSAEAAATTQDGTAPVPDPMTWQTVPYSTSPSSIAMVATTASDPNGVQYYFDCTAGGGNDSGWQDSPTYEDTGLNDRTQYTYTVRARDLSSNYNVTADSEERSATTQDGTAPDPDPMTWATVPYATGPYSIAMVATTATDPNGVQYYFTETSGNPGGSDSGWQDSPTYEDTGLNDRTQYTYTVRARDLSSNYNVTADSEERSATTQDGTAPDPDPMTWATVPYATGPYSIAMVATTATDPNGVQYYFTETSGNPGGSDSGWQDSPTYEDTGLNDRTEYKYTVKARDLSTNFNETVPSAEAAATTQDGTAPVPDPMTWQTVPYSTSPSSIAMVATTASDPNGVQYYFANLTDPNQHDSGWQNSPFYEDTGLDDRTEYTYTVRARDLSINYNETAPSVAASATTEDGTPPVPDPMTWQTPPYATGTSSIAMLATTATDPNGVQYYFDNLTDPNHDSGWQNSPFFEDTGLDDRTYYTYTVKARDLSTNYNETVPSAEAAETTEDGTPPVPDPMTWATVPYATGPYSIAMVATTATDPNGVQYYFANITDPNQHDSGWQNSPFYEDTGLDDQTEYTYTVKARDLSVNYNETAASVAASVPTPDGTPPEPDPMTWDTAPYATGPSSIAMVATTASDTNGVEYYFTCVAGPGHNSGWQDSPTYEDTGLDDRTQYGYTVKARDLSVNYNQTAASVVGWATTPDGTPPTPDPMTWETVPYATSPSSIAMVATTASDPNGVQYYFTCTDGGGPGGNDSGWQNSASYEDTGLAELTAYTYTVKARDLSVNYNVTAPSEPMTAITEDGTPPTPDPMTWASVPHAEWATWADMIATAASDPSGVEYYFAELGGNSGGSDSGWQDSRVYTDTGLAAETLYAYTVRARDKSINQNETQPSTAELVTTPPPRPPLANDVIGPTYMNVPVTITLDVIDDGLPDPPAVLSYIVTSLPNNGALSDPGAGLIDTVEYTLVNNGNYVIYTPDSDYLGLDGFSFKADDGGVPPQGGQSNEADVFISIVLPEHFTEFFYWNENDLGNYILTFVPDGSANFYMLCREDIAEFPTDPGGTVLNGAYGLDDDDSVQVVLTGGKQVSIYGHSYSSFWVGSNGYITFDSPDSTPDETFAGHFSKKRISGLFDDLDPSAGGTVSYEQYPDRMVVTFENVPEEGTTNSNSFQIEMFFEGTICLTHLNIDAADGLTGLSRGSGIPSKFIDTDMSTFFVCSDFNRDYRINLGDFSRLAEYWLDENCSNLIWCEGADLDRSDQVDSWDFDHFGQYWLERIPVVPPTEVEDYFLSIGSEDGRVWDAGDGGGRPPGADPCDYTADALRLGDYYTANEAYRTIVAFDTSSIPADARVLSVTLTLTSSTIDGQSPFEWGGSCLIDIASPYFGSDLNLVAEDWGAAAGAVAVASFLEDPGEYSPMVSTEFNIEGRMNINKFGTTQLRVYFTTPTNGDNINDNIKFYSGDWPYNENYRPELRVRYMTRTPTLKFVSIAGEDGRVYDDGNGVGAGYEEEDSGSNDRKPLRLGDYYGNQGYRTILSFDTSSSPEYYKVESVVLQMTRGLEEAQNNPFDWGGTCFIDVANPYFGTSTALEAMDWHAVADANSVAYFEEDPGEDKTMVSTDFNAEGISSINLDGKTQLRVYFTIPTNGDSVRDSLGFYSGFYETFESYRPKLIIRYSPD
jgi:hypothetical protein